MQMQVFLPNHKQLKWCFLLSCSQIMYNWEKRSKKKKEVNIASGHIKNIFIIIYYLQI